MYKNCRSMKDLSYSISPIWTRTTRARNRNFLFRLSLVDFYPFYVTSVLCSLKLLIDYALNIVSLLNLHYIFLLVQPSDSILRPTVITLCT